MSTADRGHAEVAARRQGYAALLAVQLFFGLFPLFGKVAFGEFSPSSIAAWRIGAGALALGAIAFASHGRAALPQRRDWPRLFACALLGIVLNMVLFLEGLERSTAINTALLLPLIPVFTAVVAVVLRQERFDAVRSVGMAVAFCGAGLLVVQRGGALQSSQLTGNLLVVANELCYAVYLVVARPLLARYPPIVVIAWVFLLSTWAVPFLADTRSWPLDAAAEQWASLGYILVFPTILAYLFNVYALARVSASTTAAFIFVQPLVTVIGGVLWLREPLPDRALVAAALTFGGVWIVVRRHVARPLPTAARSDARG